MTWHTAHNTLHDRPAAADAAHQDARQQAQAAIGGSGHQWARREAQRLEQQAAGRRTTHARTEHDALQRALTPATEQRTTPDLGI